jgi:hypothetical protein
MSSLATAYICEEEAIDALASLFKRIQKAEPVRMRILEFMREAANSSTRLRYGILIVSGLSQLLKSKYVGEEDPITLFKEALRNLSRETTLLIQVRSIEWKPGRRSQITIDGIPMPVSDIDIETTIKLRTEYFKPETRRGKRRENFVIVKL